VTTYGSAEISACGLYRYALTRRWSDCPTVAFVMLNPSVADHVRDDPTLRRVTAFAKTWGYGGLAVVNVYAFRATQPADLWKAADPIGPDNDLWLKFVVADCRLIVAAWGANARPERIADVLALPGMSGLTALGVTKGGQPRHPLYLRADLVPQPWAPVSVVAARSPTSSRPACADGPRP
jgi:hypothetical protein